MNTRQYPQLLLERFVLGELPEPQRSEIASAVESDPSLAARVRALAESNSDILAAYPPQTAVRDMRLRAHALDVAERAKPSSARSSRRFVVPALGMAALLAVVLVPVLTVQRGAQVSERVKGGGARLVVYRQTPDGGQPLADADSVGVGDVLQVGYVAGASRYGVIFSLDGRGETTLHFPVHPDSSTELEQGGERLLEFAYQLDDAPQFEHFFLVSSDSPLNTTEVLDSARSFAARFGAPTAHSGLRLPRGCSYSSLALRK